ncbi:twin-arginine translocase TatA/TatE family subunit [Naasia lichenicola]|uniref:Sec-independent protein translocase TatB n=1 Tax=Naasia lichenicola TaxID=2565933 RepID=A0A4S4FED8_9MICO|nr:twin-arginine translocase TatA/TatE family subunit [Naasia lichenicola]THG28483.1 Sec-independent protein translocase TatB [Naasia lichenicola]
MFGLTFEKLLLIGVVAVLLVGPDRLPRYAAQLAHLVRNLRGMADGAKSRMREEMGPEFDEVDWKKLDPRQYDPRRIIREALIDDTPVVRKPVSSTTPPGATAAGGAAAASVPGAPAGEASADPPAPFVRSSSAPKPYIPKAKPAAPEVAPFDTEAT